MEFKTLSLREEDRALFVTLNNPPINLMNGQMVQELFMLSGVLMRRPDLAVVVMDSADKDFFIAHFDLDELESSATDPGKASRYPEINVLQSLALAWQGLPQVTIAKIDGRLRGGGLEFILALNMRFASDRSLLCFPEASGNFLACGGGVTRTFIAAGPARGLEFLLSARDFSGEEAERYGLVNRSLPAAELEAYVADLVSRLRTRPSEIIALHRAVQSKLTEPMTDTFFAALAAENDGFRACLASGKMQESAKKHQQIGQTRETELDLPATIARLAAE